MSYGVYTQVSVFVYCSTDSFHVQKVMTHKCTQSRKHVFVDLFEDYVILHIETN